MSPFVFVLSLTVLGADRPDYEREIAPIFQLHCAGCHNATDQEGGFSVESIDAMVRGGEHGPALTPGQPASSRLWLMVSGRMEPKMPPEEEEPLSEAELEKLSAWIETGAEGPQGEMPLRRNLLVPKIEVKPGQTQPITAIAIAATSNRMAEARYGAVQIHDYPDQSLAIKPPSATRDLAVQGKVTKLAFSPDGKLLAVASGVTGVFGQVTLVDAGTGKMLRELIGHRDILYDAVFSPDGKRLATAGYDRSILIWDVAAGEIQTKCLGHNGAIYELDFSQDGKVLVSASADNTVKVWNAQTGERLDTLGQPQQEALCVTFSPDDQWIVAGSADNRFRVWKFVSRERAAINPLLETRFADESPLTKVRFTPDGKRLVVISEAGSVKIFETDEWNQVAVNDPLDDLATGVAFTGQHVFLVSQMNGKVKEYLVKNFGEVRRASASAVNKTPSLAVVSASSLANRQPAVKINEAVEAEPNSQPDQAQQISAPVTITGVIGEAHVTNDEDWFRFAATAGERWVIEVKAARDKSPLDSVVEIRTAQGEPIEQVRMQAVRDSYFTFRGKDSDTSDDFRLFAWEEMELNEYLYANGEIVRLWLYPRGPDSGFKVYPGAGKRWTFFETSPLAHALAEPAYIVRPLATNEPPIANGLPVFSIKTINDDDPQREWGRDSRLHFTAPATGEFLVRLRDARDASGPNYKYALTLRQAQPAYSVRLTAFDKPIPRGAGREFNLQVQRTDGFDAAVEVFIEGLPPGIHATSPVVIEAGQQSSEGILYADADAVIPKAPFTPTSYSRVLGGDPQTKVEVTGWKPISVSERPKVQVIIEPVEENMELTSVDHSLLEGADSKAIELPEAGPLATSPWTLRIKRGQTVAARLVVLRDGFNNRVQLGKEDAGRSLPFAVFVDNIGLSGLMVPEGASRRTFFITAAPVATPQRRLFYLKSDVDGGITSTPVVLALD